MSVIHSIQRRWGECLTRPDTPPGPGRYPPGPDPPETRQLPPRTRPPQGPGRYPPGPDTPPTRPPDQTPPGSDRSPPDQTPQDQTPPGPGWYPPWDRTSLPPPGTADSGIRSTIGRYASYWNAFLFVKRFYIEEAQSTFYIIHCFPAKSWGVLVFLNLC